MELFLDNKKEYYALDTSTVENITLLVDTYAEVDTLVKEFNVDNLKNLTLNGVVYERIIPLGITTETAGNKIAVTFVNRTETTDERFERQIKDLQETITTLIEGSVE